VIQLVRDGQKVWPTCPECGCRLEILENYLFVTLRHFGLGRKDARGCACSYIDDEWTTQKKEISHLGYC
jgi:hypothetical protein